MTTKTTKTEPIMKKLTMAQEGYAEVMSRHYKFNLQKVRQWVAETNPEFVAPEKNRNSLFIWAFC